MQQTVICQYTLPTHPMVLYFVLTIRAVPINGDGGIIISCILTAPVYDIKLGTLTVKGTQHRLPVHGYY